MLTTDHQLALLLDYPFALRLGHQELTATIDEIVAIHPALATDGGILQRVAHLSGGVPALLRVQHPFDAGYHAAMVKAGMPWARRLYERLVQDDLMALQMWIGRVTDETFADLAQRATESRVGSAAIRAAFEEPFVTSPGTLHAGLPGGLARALQELAQRRDPVWGQMVRARLASAVMEATGMRAFDRMFVLIAIGAWESLDDLMSTKMHLLAVLSPALRRWLDVVWPRHVPRTLTYLAYARRLLDGSAELGEMPHGTPANWHDLIYLFRGEAPPAPGTMKAYYGVSSRRRRQA